MYFYTRGTMKKKKKRLKKSGFLTWSKEDARYPSQLDIPVKF